MRTQRVVIVGSGIGGLSAAVALASAGLDVTVLDKEAAPGGKMRSVPVGGAAIDGGPTVFTMRWVFDELLDAAGTSLEAEVGLDRAETLARHAWKPGERLDLFTDIDRSADAIGIFAGAVEARRFRAFCDQSARVFRTLEVPFLRSSRPNPISLTHRVGYGRIGEVFALRPFASFWKVVSEAFEDPRLRQLYGRYATYCGSNPFDATATLMIVAHVEQNGVWLVRGGMHQLARALERVATGHGATFRYQAPVARILVEAGRVSGVELASGERISADAVIANADASALGAGLFGPEAARAARVVKPPERSLSAFVWTMRARTEGWPLARHTIAFCDDYAREFETIFGTGRMPDDPTIYVCAHDRDDTGALAHSGDERLLILANAPALGDQRMFGPDERARAEAAMRRRLSRSGLELDFAPENSVLTTPNEFNTLFPATGGALYGRAAHGWLASFLRPDATTPIPGLYLAGGSIHPGPGVPMAALSGRLAARSLLSALASTGQFRPVAIPGGMSTPSPRTAVSD